MPYLLVLIVAAAAGSGAAAFTLRHGRVAETRPEAWTKGYEAPDPSAAAGAPDADDRSSGGRRGLPSAPTWQTRLTGIVGLLIAVLVGAGLIVGACFAVYGALRRVLGG